MNTIIEADAMNDDGTIRGSIRVEQEDRTLGGLFDGGVVLHAEAHTFGREQEVCLDDFGWQQMDPVLGGDQWRPDGLALPQAVWRALEAVIESAYTAGVQWAATTAQASAVLFRDRNEPGLLDSLAAVVRDEQRAQGTRYFADLAEPNVAS